jgi:pimeloyl-ACP methyl ester carboxylesterase
MLIVFSHANSFPAATYRVLFRHLEARGFTVRAPERFGHSPEYPVTNNWPHLVAQLHALAEQAVIEAGEPAWLVGHSLGGFLSVMCAARHPEVARGVLLLDSPLLGGWRASALGAAKRTALVGAVSPGAVSRRRRTHWASREEALAHFRTKKAFTRWEPQVLQDYVDYCTHDHGGQRVLSFDRDVETAIYNTLPDNLERLLRRRPLRCQAAFVGGLHSAEVRQLGLALTQRITRGRVAMLDGSHLFPMEKPLATAAQIEASLLALPAAGY